MITRERNKTQTLILTALFTAIVAVCSQIIIPIGSVPLSLSTFAVLLAGVVLGSTAGATSLMVYMLLGIAGAPVFSALRGGIGVLTGPTGGFIVGYIPMAFIAGCFYSPDSPRRSILGMTLASAALYLLGLAWFMFSTGQNFVSALFVCVLPFIPGDVMKAVAVMMLAGRLEPFRAYYGVSVKK